MPENEIAAHAGCNANYCNFKGINSISIGIDLRQCNSSKDGKPYTKEQHDALNKLLADLKNRNIISEISDTTIVAHFEISKRKNDPLPGFEWLSINGIQKDHREIITKQQKTPFLIAATTPSVPPNVA